MIATIVGMILLVAMALILVFWRQHFVWFLAAMVPFPQTAMFIVEGQGVSPFYAAAIVASVLGVVAVLKSLMVNGLSFVPFRGRETVLLFAFAVWATFITIFGPRIFEGIGVISPRLGFSDQLSQQTPLTFTISNFAQLAYMLLGVGLIVYVLSLPKLSPRILEVGIWTGLGFTFVNAIYAAVGAQFPRELFDTIPTIYYQGGGRLRGPFAEPSVLGAFLVASLTYLLIQAVRSRGRQRALAVVGIAIGVWEFTLSTSGTTFVAGALIAFAGVIVFIGIWVSRRMRGVDIVTLVVILGVTVILFFWERVFGFLDGLVRDKLASNSFADRSSADDLAYRLTLDTFGFGLGLGSNRPSGFVAMMLSCVGVIGTALFIALILSAATRTMQHAPAFLGTAWAMLGIVAAMSIAKADLPTPMLWMSLAVCMWACVRLQGPLQSTHRNHPAARHEPSKIASSVRSSSPFGL